MPLNKPSPRLAILRAQLAAKAADEAFARALYSYSAQNPRTLRALPPLADSLPLPPSYDEDLEHWLKTLAPAKPAAEQPAKSQDASGWRRGPRVPYGERLGLWHVRACADDKDVSNATDAVSLGFVTGCEYRRAVRGAVVGDPYDESKYTAPAQQTAQKASTHSVCFKSYAGIMVGYVAKGPGDPRFWLPCDESGWVTHVPTKEAGSPVPVGVLCCIMQEDGSVRGDTKDNPAREGKDWFGWDSIIIAWRPIAQS